MFTMGLATIITYIHKPNVKRCTYVYLYVCVYERDRDTETQAEKAA